MEGVGLAMTWFRTLFVPIGTLLSLAAASFGAPPADPMLDAVLARLDQVSTTFKGLTADIRKLAHTDVVNADDVDSGTITVKRVKARDTWIRIDFTNPRRQSVSIDRKSVV